MGTQLYSGGVNTLLTSLWGNVINRVNQEQPHLQESPLQDVSRLLEFIGLAPIAVCEKKKELSSLLLGQDAGRGY
jgi:hypothetical protein